MKILILKPFTDPSSPRSFQPQERVEVPDSKANKWIKQGYAIALDGPPDLAVAATPQKCTPETAAR